MHFTLHDIGLVEAHEDGVAKWVEMEDIALVIGAILAVFFLVLVKKAILYRSDTKEGREYRRAWKEWQLKKVRCLSALFEAGKELAAISTSPRVCCCFPQPNVACSCAIHLNPNDSTSALLAELARHEKVQGHGSRLRIVGERQTGWVMHSWLE